MQLILFDFDMEMNYKVTSEGNKHVFVLFLLQLKIFATEVHLSFIMLNSTNVVLTDHMQNNHIHYNSDNIQRGFQNIRK